MRRDVQLRERKDLMTSEVSGFDSFALPSMFFGTKWPLCNHPEGTFLALSFPSGNSLGRDCMGVSVRQLRVGEYFGYSVSIPFEEPALWQKRLANS